MTMRREEALPGTAPIEEGRRLRARACELCLRAARARLASRRSWACVERMLETHAALPSPRPSVLARLESVDAQELAAFVAARALVAELRRAEDVHGGSEALSRARTIAQIEADALEGSSV